MIWTILRILFLILFFAVSLRGYLRWKKEEKEKNYLLEELKKQQKNCFNEINDGDCEEDKKKKYVDYITDIILKDILVRTTKDG
jgi:hypothetical protein